MNDTIKKRKHILGFGLLLILVFIQLVGCNQSKENEAKKNAGLNNQKKQTAQEFNEEIMELVRNGFEVSLLYSVKSLGFSYDGEIQIQDKYYYPVVDERFVSLEEFQTWIESIFAEPQLKVYSSSTKYIEYEGRFYTDDVETGTFCDYVNFTAEIPDNQKESMTLQIKILDKFNKENYEQWEIQLVHKDSWKIKNMKKL